MAFTGATEQHQIAPTRRKPERRRRVEIRRSTSRGVRRKEPQVELTFSPYDSRTPRTDVSFAEVARPDALRKDRNGRRARVDTNALLRAAVLLTMIVAAFFLVFSSGVEADSAPHSTVLHVVKPGDTLWNLAAQSTPAGDDVRATVDLIRNINDLPSSTVLVGEEIELPVRR
jgi:nucleoid-associated protein YgaU